MEANKGTAEECLAAARRHLNRGNYAQARKFLQKSKKLYPLPGVDALLKRAETSMASESSSAADIDAKKKAASKQRANPSEAAPSRPYTAEQAAMVQRIKQQGKDHYGVLGQ